MIRIGKFYLKGKYIPVLSMFNFIHKKIGTARRFNKKEIINLTKFGFKILGVDYMMPPFDYFKFGRKYLKGLTNVLETSLLKYFGMTLIVVLQKN